MPNQNHLCAGTCGRRLVPAKTQEVPEGHARTRARGMCNACHHRAKRAGTLDQYRTRLDPDAAAARLEDLEFLLRWDHNAQSIATRAGFPGVGAVEVFLRRRGRLDLVRQFNRYAANCDVYTDGYQAAAFGVTQPGWRVVA